MTIPELIKSCEKRLVYLQTLRSSATDLGDLRQVDALDVQIAETQDTLNKLRTVQ